MHAAGGQGQNVAMTTMFKQFGSTTTRDSASDDNDDEWENPADFDNLFASATDVCILSDLDLYVFFMYFVCSIFVLYNLQ